MHSGNNAKVFFQIIKIKFRPTMEDNPKGSDIMAGNGKKMG